MDYPTYLSFSRGERDWYRSGKYPWKQIVHELWRWMSSATSNEIHPQLRQPTHLVSTPSCEKFINDEVWLVLSKSILTLPLTLVRKYVTEHPDHECVLVKAPLALQRRLSRPYHQIDDILMITAFTNPGVTSNLFCTPFLCCTSSTLVALNVITPEQTYYNRLPQYYIYATKTYKRSMHTFIVDDNYPPRSDTTVSKQLQIWSTW